MHVHVDELAISDVSRARLVATIITRHIALNIVSVSSDRTVQGLCDVITIFLAKFLPVLFFYLNGTFLVSQLTCKSLRANIKLITTSLLL